MKGGVLHGQPGSAPEMRPRSISAPLSCARGIPETRRRIARGEVHFREGAMDNSVDEFLTKEIL